MAHDWDDTRPGLTRRKEHLLGRTARLGLLLTISVLVFAAFGSATASASVVCMVDSTTAGIFDANSVSQNQCNLPPGVSGTDEANTISITRNVSDNPLVPGTQTVTSVTFTDTN